LRDGSRNADEAIGYDPTSEHPVKAPDRDQPLLDKTVRKAEIVVLRICKDRQRKEEEYEKRGREGSKNPKPPSSIVVPPH